MIGKNPKRLIMLLLLPFVLGANNKILAQSTAFTYQGRLQDSGTNANGSYDFQFTLWDALSGGTQQPQPAPVTVTRTSVAVANGVFTVQLDFGASAFPGADRFLEMSVRLAGGGAFTLLSPRQPISSTPYAIRALSATTADALSSACVGCVQDSQINSVAGNKVSGAIPVASVPGGSGNYIQNTTTQQAGSNFNISGNGTAGGTLSGNIINASTQFNLGGSRAFAATGANGQENTFVGLSAGTTGNNSSFFGFAAGNANAGPGNSFFGRGAGQNNTTGANNSFFGFDAGFNNTTGSNNTFIGKDSNGSPGITNATAIGANTSVTQSNSLVLGSINGVNSASADTNIGIGTTAPGAPLDVLPSGGKDVLIGGGNVTGSELKLTNSGTAHFSIYNSGNNNLTFANTSALISVNTTGTPLMVISSSGNVGLGGVTSPTSKLQVNGQARFSTVNIDSYVGGQNLTLCTTNVGVNQNLIGLCSSSLRYKTNVRSFSAGLDVINRLRPISFDWKDGGMHDIGLAAEEVNQVEPLLAFRNNKGEIEGVKYNQLSAVFINAFNEQQAQIQRQQEQLSEQQRELKQQRALIEQQTLLVKGLRRIVCRHNTKAALCRD